MRTLTLAVVMLLTIGAFGQSSGALHTPALFTMDIIHNGGGAAHNEQYPGNACTGLDSLPPFKVVATAIVTYTDDSIHTTSLGRVADAPCVFGVFDNGYNLFRDKKGVPWHMKMRGGGEGSTLDATVYYIYSDHGDLDPAFQQHFFVSAAYPPPSTGKYNSASGNCFPVGVNYAVNGYHTITAAEAGITVTTGFNVKGGNASWITVGRPKGFSIQSTIDGKVWTNEVANIKVQGLPTYNYNLNGGHGKSTGAVVLGGLLLLPLLFLRRRAIPAVIMVVFMTFLFVACKKDNILNTSGVKTYRLATYNQDGTTTYTNQ